VGLSDEDLMKLLGKPGVHPEGRFFPDTYTYSKGSTDVALLQRAMRAMDKRWPPPGPRAPPTCR
jgi:UPF0755 protein